MADLDSRLTFKSFDKKDRKIFASAANLEYISSKETWIVYRAKRFKRSIFEMSDFENFEMQYTEKLRGHSAVFSTFKGLPFSLPSLQIGVSKSGKLIYNAIIVSVSACSEDVTLSPLLLISKTTKKATILVVHHVLQNIFNCQFLPITPTISQCYWLIGIAVYETLKWGNRSSCITFNFKFPIPTVAEFEASLNPESLALIWKSIPYSHDNQLDFRVIELFLSETFHHLNAVYKIKFSNAVIKFVGLKDVCVSFGKELLISVHKPEVAISLLSYLETDCHSD